MAQDESRVYYCTETASNGRMVIALGLCIVLNEGQ
jgi:hypothetical protein